MNIKEMSHRIANACCKRGWRKDWSNGGCYLHLEVSEFIEALRGKNGSPEEEAADVFITLMALIGANNVNAESVRRHIESKVKGIEDGSVGVHVNYSA